ncbi:CRISPR-associated endoribonuclease Cas6 [Thermovenabulum gondwanense]|uniref:CRISPR-associated endoribonuclease Cas6 n=1 Tax=Thermovenabulum gondwanense TaxID=520767 RepID=UPI000A062BE9|nr:CRISPR-associated endoribonuclease Cas6 [Thermovenabulum gondwanense]
MKNNKRSKNFCFSVFLRNYKLVGDFFESANEEEPLKLFFNVSYPDAEFVLRIYNGLLNIPNFKYKDFKLKRGSVRLIREKSITNNEVVFKTLSPLYIRGKDGKPLTPINENFEIELNYIMNTVLMNYRGYGLKRDLCFTPLDLRKQIIKEKIESFIKKTGKEYMTLTVYKGAFKLFGDPEDLRDIYFLGIGFRRSEGFGMVEVV